MFTGRNTMPNVLTLREKLTKMQKVTPVEEKVLKFWYHLYESNLKYQV